MAESQTEAENIKFSAFFLFQNYRKIKTLRAISFLRNIYNSMSQKSNTNLNIKRLNSAKTASVSVYKENIVIIEKTANPCHCLTLRKIILYI